MNVEFQKIIEKFPGYMNELQGVPPVSYSELNDIPKMGVYVYYENEKPVYVGRSKNIRQRFRQHRQQSSGHNSATFAFRLAKHDAEKRGIDIHRTREKLQNDDKFIPIFSESKRRVSVMKIQVIQMNDPVEQTLFEVYAALKMKTEYNTWETH